MASSTKSLTLTIEQLEKSPFNVRKNEEDANHTADLEPSILAHGLMHALVVHPLKGRKGMYGVHAGARRRLAIQRLIERGELPADWPIRCEETDLAPAALVELSALENMMRKPLRPSEEFVAIDRAIKGGIPITDVARHFGHQPRWAEQYIRLANLAPAIFAEFEADRLPLDLAKAFAASEHHGAQIAAWEKYQQEPSWNRNAATVRRLLKVGDDELDRLLRFVDEKVYQSNGGRYEYDLFAEAADERGRVVDEKLLRELADTKLQAIRDAVRASAGRTVPFRPEPPKNEYRQTDRSLEIFPVEEDGKLQLPEGDVIATLTILSSGEAEQRFWWADKKAQQAASKPDRKKGVAAKPAPASVLRGSAAVELSDGSAINDSWNYRQHADAQARETTSLTTDGVSFFRSLRRAALRALLVRDAEDYQGTVARDYLIWAQARLLLSNDNSGRVGMKGLQQPDHDAAALPYLAEQPATDRWSAARDVVAGCGFILQKDLQLAFEEFVGAPDRLKNLTAAVVAGFGLERSLESDGYRIPVHDALAKAMGMAGPLAMREMIVPTPKLLGLFSKLQILEMAQPFVGVITTAAWAKKKSAEVVDLVLKVLQGTSAELDAPARDRAKLWVHPLLAFRPRAVEPEVPEEPANQPVNDQHLQAAE